MLKSNFTQDNEASLAEQNHLPHNIEIEQAILGALLMNNRVLDEILDVINEDSFHEPLHQRIFIDAKKTIKANQVASPISLKDLYKEETVGPISVAVYLGHLVADACLRSEVTSYSETLKDLHDRRQGILAADHLMSDMFNLETPSRTGVEGAQGALDKLSEQGGPNSKSKASLAESALDVINEMKDPVQSNAISTSLNDLDKVLCGGWPRGELTIVAARPSVGKSAFITSSMLRSSRDGYEVLCFSMEMQRQALAARCLSDITYNKDDPIKYSDIIGKSLDQDRWYRLEKAQKDFNDYALDIDDQRGLTVTNILSRIRRHIHKLDKDGRKLDLVVIDHLGKIKAEDYAGHRHLELGAITEQLAVIAGDYDIAMVVLCQLNRGVEGRDNKRPTLADLRESGRIEEDANCVIGLHRPGYYLERMKCDNPEDEEFRQSELKKHSNKFEAVVLKQRNGQCRPVELWCNMASNSIGNRGRA